MLLIFFLYVTDIWVLLTRRHHHGMPRQHTERVGARLDLYDTRDKLRDPKMHFESSGT
jgi:hypothetical protein